MGGRAGRLQPPEGSTQRQRDQFYQDLKRNARAANGRCRYCGRLPEAGKKSCERCLAIARRNAADRRERLRATRDAERRAALPRRCPACSSDNLGLAGQLKGRRRYVCRDCGRHSYGDGPPPPKPLYPCPYCGEQCIKRGRSLRVKRRPLVFTCSVCGRWNTMLWPGNPPSPGGPFPHRKRFHLNYPARDALILYCQTKKLSVAQAVSEIFIQAGVAPPLTTGGSRQYGLWAADGPATRVRSRSFQGPPPLPVPPGGARLPSAMPEALAKLTKMRAGGRFNPSILVACTVQVMLNDAALAGLLHAMRRLGMNHQDTARALITAAGRSRPVIRSGAKRDDGGLDGW